MIICKLWDCGISFILGASCTIPAQCGTPSTTRQAGRAKWTFFIALYSSNVASPSTEFWLDVKKRYNLADARAKRRMELWYLWRFGLDRNPLRLPVLIKQIYEKKKQRGMSYMTDVRDWLGGWPMEYADDQEVIDVMKKKHSFALINISTGEACTEFLFARTDDASRAAV